MGYPQCMTRSVVFKVGSEVVYSELVRRRGNCVCNCFMRRAPPRESVPGATMQAHANIWDIASTMRCSGARVRGTWDRCVEYLWYWQHDLNEGLSLVGSGSCQGVP